MYTKITVGALTSTLETDSEELINLLYERYRFKDSGAFYSPLYKRGHWDGYKNFFTLQGKFKSGLVTRIIGDLALANIYPEMDWSFKNDLKRIFEDSPEVEGIDFFDYQSEYIKEALFEQRCIVKAPTGAGKTYIMAGLIKALPAQTLVLIKSTTLIRQTYEELLQLDFDGRSIGICFGEGYIHGDIMICSPKSISKLIGTPAEYPKVLVCDEVHEFSTGSTLRKLINAFPTALYRFGFTATVPSDPIPAMTLEGAFGPVIEKTTTQTLITEGVLSKPEINLVNLTLQNADTALPYQDTYNRYVVNNTFRNEAIANIAREANGFEDTKVLILVERLEHIENLAKLLPEAILVMGEDSSDSRKAKVEQFVGIKGKAVLIGSRIFQTGVNIREVTHFINARCLKSDIATIQALGRALRVTDKISSVKVYDFIDYGIRYLSAHAKKRKAHYKSEGHTIIEWEEKKYVL